MNIIALDENSCVEDKMSAELSKKRRIEFIDLAKGVCILLVVFSHCGVNVPIPGFGMMRMPLYFILSGLFFKDYGGFFEFIVKKTNKILIPFIFFYVIAYIPFYAFNYLKPGLIVTAANGLLDVFNNRQLFNGPIWFLICLFWANIIFCAISLNVKREYVRGIIVFIVGFIGVFLGLNEVFLPCFVDVAMTALPYFYFGYLLRKTPLLYRNKYDRYNFLIAMACYAVTFVLTYYFDNPHISFRDNRISGNIFINYVGSFTSVIAVLMLCKMVKSLPIVSYCGRYSIILLCFHHLIYRPVSLLTKGLGDYANMVTAVVTIAICIGLIPLCIKFIPWFTAQRDLVKLRTRGKAK